MRGQLQPGDPALGAAIQEGHIRVGEVKAHGLAQEPGGLAAGEAQIACTDLVDVAARTHARQRQRRVGPARDNQVEGSGLVLDQEIQCVVDGLCSDDVVVVQHQQQAAGRHRQVVDEAGQHLLEAGRLARLQHRPRVRAK